MKRAFESDSPMSAGPINNHRTRVSKARGGADTPRLASRLSPLSPSPLPPPADHSPFSHSPRLVSPLPPSRRPSPNGGLRFLSPRRLRVPPGEVRSSRPHRPSRAAAGSPPPVKPPAKASIGPCRSCSDCSQVGWCRTLSFAWGRPSSRRMPTCAGRRW